MRGRRGGRSSRVLRRYFYEVLEGDRRVEDFFQTLPKRFDGSWDRGYLMGMKAILAKRKTGDPSLHLGHETSLEDLIFFSERFRRLSMDPLSRELDRGYFSSWRDYVTYLILKREVEDLHLPPGSLEDQAMEKIEARLRDYGFKQSLIREYLKALGEIPFREGDLSKPLKKKRN